MIGRFPAGADCIVYDDERCNVEKWNAPLFLQSGEKRSFSLSDSIFSLDFSPLNYKNTIESVSVRRGCKLTLYEETNYKGDKYTFSAPRASDLHVTLDE